ncbi:MAG: hypothetical protein LBN25_04440, partial [Christensenellaceae bacterium]|nr:hypothetical protein [Christensenellaceae bacterium]
MSKLAEKIRKNKLIPVVIALIAAIIALTVGLSVGYVQKDKLFKMAASQASIEYDTRIKSLDVFEN